MNQIQTTPLKRKVKNQLALPFNEYPIEMVSDKYYQVGEIELSYRTSVSPALRPKIDSSREAAKIFRETWNRKTIELQEEFKVMFTNRANRVLGVIHLSKGGISHTICDTKILFAAAINAACSGLILCHNHPSGNLTPSQADIDLTRRVKEAGKLFDITVLDHIILTADKYYSFADEGML